MLRYFVKRATTKDKEAVEVLTTTRLGAKQSLTPEGFLFCEGVPIKRTGEMLYGPGETPIKVGQDGIARVVRDEKALFDPKAVSSYVGKPVVNDHPEDDVTPKNWKRLTVGITLNPRQGTGDDKDVLLADLLITDAEAISDVQSGKREVSAGYEADYEQTGEGSGRQTNIIGNHVALVARGRCGPRCAIGDHQPDELKERNMGTKTAPRRKVSDAVLATVRKTFRDAENEALAALGNSGLEDGDGMGGDGPDEPDGDEGGGDGHTHIHIHTGGEGGAPAPAAADPGAKPPAADGSMTQDDPVEARFQKIESTLAQILTKLGGDGSSQEPPPPASDDPPPAKDEANDDLPGVDGDEAGDLAGKGKTADSAALQTSFQNLVSDAEILMPGYRVPTFDAKKTRQQTIDSMCSFRKRILDSLYMTGDGKSLIDGVAPEGFNMSKAQCPQLAVVFRAAAGAKRMLNNRTSVGDAGRLPQASQALQGKVTSLTALQEANRQFWAGRNSPAK